MEAQFLWRYYIDLFIFNSLLSLIFYLVGLVGAFKPVAYSIVITIHFSNRSCAARMKPQTQP